METAIILEEKLNHDISVKIDNKNEGYLSLSNKGADYKDKKGKPIIRLEKGDCKGASPK